MPGDIRHMTVDEINRLADEEGWTDKKRRMFLSYPAYEWSQSDASKIAGATRVSRLEVRRGMDAETSL